MARPKKTGLDYFPVDTSFDLEMEAYISQTGAEGLGLWLFLMQNIYREGGYFYINPATEVFITGKMRVSAELFRNNLDLLFTLELLDRTIFEKHGILTGRGVQTRYFEACKAMRREVVFPELFCINSASQGVIVEKQGVIAEETPVFTEKSTQSKGKETKVNESIHRSAPEKIENPEPNSQKILEVGNFIKQVEAKHADPSAPTPVNNPNAQPSTTIFDLKVRAWKEIYQANEHPDKLQRPYLEAINLLKAQHPDLDAHEFLVALTKKYLAFCTANNRFKLNGLKFLTDNTFLDDWTIQPGQKTQGTPGTTTEPKRKRIQIMGDTERIIGG